MSAILEVLGVLLGGLGGRSCDGLGSNIDVNKEIVEILESMLSPTREHGFSMVWGWIWSGF